jgi:hypothetical protein
MGHQDGIHNWDKWEQMFEATLKKEFGIKAGAEASQASMGVRRAPAPPPATARAPTLAAPPIPRGPSFLSDPYTRSTLNKMAFRLGLEVDDRTAKGGLLWVRVDDSDADTTLALRRWGFSYKPDKGWWK